MQDQDRITELERRISAAIGRIGAGVEQLSVRAEALMTGRVAASDGEAGQAEGKAAPSPSLAAAPDTAAAPVEPGFAPAPRSDSSEIARLERMLRDRDAEILRLRDALAAEKAAASDLASKLRAVRDREAATAPGALEAKVEKMTRQLDVQGLELQRMRKTTIQLREHLRVLHEAAAEGLAEPHLVNKAMLAELEALRAARHVDLAEVDEILAELEPLIEEARAHG